MDDQFPKMLHTATAATIEDLPNDVLTHVLSQLDGPTLASLSCASSRLYSLSSDPTIWRHLCLSMWPSLNHPHMLSLSIPHRSFIADAFSFPATIVPPPHAIPTDHLPKELISSVDICHNGQSIFSQVMKTDTSSPWFLGTPFRLDALERKAVMATSLPLDEVISPDKLTLSWILTDPNRCRSVNISSRLPVSIDRHRYTGETQVRFGTVLGGLLISIVVTCSEKTGHLREVSLTVEDEEGVSVNGEGSLVILTQAIEGRRRNRGDEVAVARRRYDDFAKVKRKRKETKASKELFFDLCCSAAGAAIFLCLMIALLFG